MDSEEKNRAQLSVNSRPLSLIVFLVIGFASTFLFYYMTDQWRDERIRHDFHGFAADRIAAIKSRLDFKLAGLKSLASFFESSEYVSPDEFDHYVSHMSDDTTESVSYHWVTQLSSDGAAKAAIDIRDESPAPEQFSFRYSSPASAGKTFGQINFASDSALQDVISRARHQADVHLSGVLNLPGLPLDRPPSVAAFHPVVTGHHIEGDDDTFEGFVVGIYSPKLLLERALEDFVPAGVDLFLFDVTEKDGEHLLALHGSRTRQDESALSVVTSTAILDGEVVYQQHFRVGGRFWLAVGTPAPLFLERHDTLLPELILCIGFLLTLIFNYMYYAAIRRGNEQQQLAEQTLKSRDALQRSEEMLNEAQRIARVGNWHWQVEGDLLTWTDEIYRIFDLDPEQFSPSYELFLEHVHPEDRHLVENGTRDALEKGIHYSVDHRIVVSGGSERYVHEEGEAHFVDGKPVSMMGTVQDITDRKLAEDRFRLLFDGSIDAVLIHTTDGRIIDSNAKAQALFGYSAEQMCELVIPDIHPETAQEDLERAFAQFLKQGYAREELPFIKSSGELFTGEVNASIVTLGEQPVVQAFIRDVTDKKQLEEQLRQSQKMEAVGTLVGGIAHDFNNTLAAIQGNIYLARRAVQEDPTVDQKLATVERLGLRATEMIRQLLTFARKDSVRLSTFVLNELMAETIELVRKGIPEHVALIYEAADEPVMIKGDATQLQQAVINLINNAYDAVSEVDAPLIACATHRIEEADHFFAVHPEFVGQNMMKLTIKDNGTGIAEEDISKIFEPFYTTKEVGKGTGLGLSMVYGAVQSNRGEIEVESRIGGGSCFMIYLPIADEAVQGAFEQSRDDEVLPGSGETVLLVDDEDDLRSISRDVLEDAGYRVIEAFDGIEAVEQFTKHGDIDLMISDVVMPRLGGYKAAVQIREIRADVPVIFVTGYNSEEGSGAGDLSRSMLLNKPYSVSQITKAIRSLLDSEA